MLIYCANLPLVLGLRVRLLMQLLVHDTERWRRARCHSVVSLFCADLRFYFLWNGNKCETTMSPWCFVFNSQKDEITKSAIISVVLVFF